MHPNKLYNYWAHRDSNPGPRDYESPALTAELWARNGGIYAMCYAFPRPVTMRTGKEI
jgi:hypothetical protein